MSKDIKITIEIGPDLLKAIKATLKANQKWNELICPYIRWTEGSCAPKPQSPARAVLLAFGIDINKLQKKISEAI